MARADAVIAKDTVNLISRYRRPQINFSVIISKRLFSQHPIRMNLEPVKMMMIASLPQHIGQSISRP